MEAGPRVKVLLHCIWWSNLWEQQHLSIGHAPARQQQAPCFPEASPISPHLLLFLFLPYLWSYLAHLPVSSQSSSSRGSRSMNPRTLLPVVLMSRHLVFVYTKDNKWERTSCWAKSLLGIPTHIKKKRARRGGRGIKGSTIESNISDNTLSFPSHCLI